MTHKGNWISICHQPPPSCLKRKIINWASLILYQNQPRTQCISPIGAYSCIPKYNINVFILITLYMIIIKKAIKKWSRKTQSLLPPVHLINSHWKFAEGEKTAARLRLLGIITPAARIWPSSHEAARPVQKDQHTLIVSKIQTTKTAKVLQSFHFGNALTRGRIFFC